MKNGHYYILPVFGCTDPEPLVGPFDDFDSMLVEARKIRVSQDDDDALFWLVTGTRRAGCADPAPQVNSFCSVDIDPEEVDTTDDDKQWQEENAFCAGCENIFPPDELVSDEVAQAEDPGNLSESFEVYCAACLSGRETDRQNSA